MPMYSRNEFELKLLQTTHLRNIRMHATRLSALAHAAIPTERIASSAAVEDADVEMYRQAEWADLPGNKRKKIEWALREMIQDAYAGMGRPAGAPPIDVDVQARLIESGLSEGRARREARRLRRLNESGVPTSEIALHAGVPLNAVSNYRYGRWRSMSKAHRAEIEQALGMMKVAGYSTREEREEKRRMKTRCEYLSFHRAGLCAGRSGLT